MGYRYLLLQGEILCTPAGLPTGEVVGYRLRKGWIYCEREGRRVWYRKASGKYVGCRSFLVSLMAYMAYCLWLIDLVFFGRVSGVIFIWTARKAAIGMGSACARGWSW